jgi:CMP-N-acetylneuraminic acid synthetase
MGVILGLIPARGGSKGVLRKNIRPLFGKPLIVWSIEAAKESKLIDAVAVSTDDEEIADVARKYGAEVIARPKELATDDATTLAVMQHALRVKPADVLVLLQPTSPIRDRGLIDECIQRFRSTNADSLATGFNCTYVEYGKNELRRQDIAGFFYDDGNIYINRADQILAGDRYGTRMERVLIGREQNIDIDDDFDFFMAEQVLRLRNGSK